MRRVTQLPDESLREYLAQAQPSVIYATVISESGFTPKQVLNRSRKRELVYTRHLISYFMTVDNNRSFASIGSIFGKDHATAINSRNVIESLIATDRKFKLEVIKLATKIIRITMRKKIQLIGKVKDLQRLDAVLKFKESQTELEIKGWEVWNPMEHVPTDVTRGEEMRICLRNLVDPTTTAVALQPDWVSSEGAKVEYIVANALQLKVIEL